MKFSFSRLLCDILNIAFICHCIRIFADKEKNSLDHHVNLTHFVACVGSQSKIVTTFHLHMLVVFTKTIPLRCAGQPCEIWWFQVSKGNCGRAKRRWCLSASNPLTKIDMGPSGISGTFKCFKWKSKQLGMRFLASAQEGERFRNKLQEVASESGWGGEGERVIASLKGVRLWSRRHRDRGDQRVKGWRDLGKVFIRVKKMGAKESSERNEHRITRHFSCLILCLQGKVEKKTYIESICMFIYNFSNQSNIKSPPILVSRTWEKSKLIFSHIL